MIKTTLLLSLASLAGAAGVWGVLPWWAVLSLCCSLTTTAVMLWDGDEDDEDE